MILNSEVSQRFKNCQSKRNLFRQMACRFQNPSVTFGNEAGLASDARRGAGIQPLRSLFMRCIYCQARAGILRKVCPPCGRIVAIVEDSAGRLGWTELIDIFAGEGLTKAEVDRVLDAEIEGAPTLRDRLTSRMANELMKGLGMPGRQSPEDVRRVRLGLASRPQGT